MKILSIDGGGYLGLATASFIEETERHFGKKFHSQFDLFCGTSTGAIIALALASGLDGSEIRAMYEDFGPKVFNNPVPGQRYARMGTSLMTSMYSNDKLQASLAKAFGDRTLGDLHRAGKRVLVTAFSLTAGAPRVFKTNHGPGLSNQSQLPLHQIALASSAAPIYLPIVEIKDPETNITEQFCDGGTFANYPGLLGYTEALHHCGATANNVKLLSLSTPRGSLAEHKSTKWLLSSSLNRSAISWFLLRNLSGVMIDGTTEITDQAVQRLVKASPGAIYERIMFKRPDGTDMDIATAKASETLRLVGSQESAAHATRERMKVFLN